jgi:hypothetical protein
MVDQAPEAGMFTKGLAVVDDVAYFGVSRVEPRDARTDPALDCQLAAFDLPSRRLLWRRQVCILPARPFHSCICRTLLNPKVL